MKNKVIKISTKISTAMVVAASVMTMASITAFAADDTEFADETVTIEEVAATVEAPECEMSVPEIEGQGDIIDDQFVYVEGQGDVIDDQFAYVEGQDDVIDVEYAVVPEVEPQPVEETFTETTETPEEDGLGDIIDDEFVYVEGQGDVIDDEFAVSEEEAWIAACEARTAGMAQYCGEIGTVEMDLHNAEWYQEYQKAEEAKKAEEEKSKQLDEIVAEFNESMKPLVDAVYQARLMEETKDVVKESETKNVKAPAVDMSFYHYTFIGYHGDRVDYEDLVPGKFYLMQVPGKTTLPSFSYKVVKITGSYNDNGREMVTYDKYDTNGKLEGRNKKTQGNVTATHLKPNHFFELTDDILAK